MATRAENKRLLESEQGQQWLRLGLVKESNEDGEHTLVWTKKGEEFAKYSSRRLVMDLVMGRKLESWMSWEKFDENGFVKLIDYYDYWRQINLDSNVIREDVMYETIRTLIYSPKQSINHLTTAEVDRLQGNAKDQNK